MGFLHAPARLVSPNHSIIANTHEEILGLGTGGYECTCCTSTVALAYGTATPGLPEHLRTCGGCEVGDCEDWAPATAIVAGNKEERTGWSPGPRIVVPISDEGPRCGDSRERGTRATLTRAMGCGIIGSSPIFS